MAEESGQEKTEEATPKKLEKAREEGQVARSKELNTLAVLLAGATGLLLFGGMMVRTGMRMIEFSFVLERDAIFDSKTIFIHLEQAASEAMMTLTPFFLLVLLGAFIGPVSLGGWLVSSKALAPKLSRISPLEGFKRMFSSRALMELSKAVAKVLIVASVAIVILYVKTDDLLLLGKQSYLVAISSATSTLIWSFLLLSLSMIVIALVDVPFQIADHAKKMKMSVQEVKDELKNTEGKPEVRGRIRQLQQEMAKQRMMSNVPDADVVITNPTHFAIAIKYDPATMPAPIVVAKGADQIALMIRKVGEANSVPLLSYPLLARAIYYSTELAQQIPEGLFVAIAQILAYVLQLKTFEHGAGPRPRPLGGLRIPDEFKDLDKRL